MVPAAVGFQCPDDVRAGQRGVREPRTAFGGRISSDAGRTSMVLIGLNVAVHLLGMLGGDLALRFGNIALARSPDGLVGVADGQVYRLLTAAFLHGGLFHLLSNMLALASVGPALEATLGRARFLVLYVVSALGGSTLSFLVSTPNQLGVGASGAIFGLFGAYYVVARRTGADTRQIVGLLALNLVITFALPIIDWRAHLGGLVVGALVAVSFAYARPGSRRNALQAAGVTVVLVVLAAALLLRAAALRG